MNLSAKESGAYEQEEEEDDRKHFGRLPDKEKVPFGVLQFAKLAVRLAGSQ